MIVVQRPTVIRAGILKTIHMVGATIRLNKQRGTGKPENAYTPCITVHCVDGTYHGRYVAVDGLLECIQQFGRPLATGAVAFLRTRAEVTISPTQLDKVR